MKNKLLFFIILISFVFSCYSNPEKAEKPPAAPPPETINTLTLVATGDNLFHETIIDSSLKNGVYDFTPVYSEIKSIIESADLAFINQETVMGGASFGYSGYPAFNTPQSLAKTIADTGFDIVNQANNHAMDMGKKGLIATLDLWDTIEGITVIGARKEGDSARIITKNNISLGFLSYTYGLNGIALPADNPNLVSLINKNKMETEIDALRPLCDFLIVSIHWGDEYKTEPGKTQTDLALFMAEHGVDLIIGHHPHVLQRAQTITLDDGRKTFCIYSLGNFVSNQRETERIIGGMLAVTFTKKTQEEETKELIISDFGMIPVICHFDRGFINTKVYPLYSYTEDLLKNHALKNKDLTIDSFYAILKRMETKIYMHNPF
jgi:poly-gamma-glutamate synthesis protein (capsule biosynthesis protein)